MNQEQQKHSQKAVQSGTQHMLQCQSTVQRQLIQSENNFLKSIAGDQQYELCLKGWGIQTSQVKEQDHRFDQYISLLKENGAIIQEKLACGIFQLKNGLTYPGLYAKHHINPGLTKDQGKQQILVAMPVKLLLTSYRAQHQSASQLRNVFKNQQFYHSGPIWQNRILITYILHILSNPDIYQDSLWYKMSYLFSKDIDILSFWEEEQLNKFTDKSISRAAKMERDNFEKQWKDFLTIQHKYQILKDNMFTYQNYRWIYVHCISRCFGSFLNCSYFVPFCQFLNHHCVDVSYSCMQSSQFSQKVAEIEQQKIEQQILQKQQGKAENEEELEISDISEQSGNSEDYIGEDDFSYETVNSYTIKWNSKISFNLKQKQVKQIQMLQKKVQKMLEQDVLWKGFGLLYIGEILQKNNVIVNQFMAERKRFTQAKEELQLLAYHIRTFRKHVIQFYKGLGCQYLRDKNAMLLHTQSSQGHHQQSNISKPQPTSSCTPKLPESQPPDNPYQTFIMLCHRTQQFAPNSQVYFEYNRLSNRTLLLRYGFCLENNKYEHVWVSKSLAKEIGQYPDLFRKIQEKCISIVFKVKLKPYVLNTQFIVAEKVQKWKMYGNVTQQNAADFEKMFGITDIDQQCQIIQRVIQIYQKQLPKYGQQIALTDKSLTYHNYFRSVYQNQKIKLLKWQILLLIECKKILIKIKEQKIQIKGNKNILKQIKKICLKQLSTNNNKKYLIKCIWGYIKMIAVSVVS